MSIIRTSRQLTFRNGVQVDERIIEEDVTTETNDRTIRDRLADDLAAVNLITSASGTAFTQAGVRDLQRQVKDLARMNKRLIRLALGALESAD